MKAASSFMFKKKFVQLKKLVYCAKSLSYELCWKKFSLSA